MFSEDPKERTYMGVSENYLVGGFNPSEKYSSNGKSSPNSGENKNYLKPPPSYGYPQIIHFNVFFP